MKLQEFKNVLQNVDTIEILLPNHTKVPVHFHITEMGLLSKKFIDCGNTIREEKFITFQIWFAGDLDHRLKAEKVLKIIDASKSIIGDQNLELEVEYQTETTIGKFGLNYTENQFYLTPKETTCLASNHCGIPAEKMKVKIGEWKVKENSCSGSKCC